MWDTFMERLRQQWADGRHVCVGLDSDVTGLPGYAPGVPVILDAKRGDNETTNRGYVTAIFDELGADAVTVHPFLGEAALRPFLDRKECGIFVLCRTSNASAPEFQDLDTPQGKLYEVVARHVAGDWNAAGNCGLVVGATYPGGIRRVRRSRPPSPCSFPASEHKAEPWRRPSPPPRTAASRHHLGPGRRDQACPARILTSSGRR